MSGISKRTEEEEEAAAAFRVRFAEDRGRGSVRNVSEYLRLHPGHEDRIAIEFARLRQTAGDAASNLSSAADAADPAGRVGPYRILRELGRGGQGAVYLAEDVRVKREVALKVLTGLGRLTPLALERFRREAMIASKLDHPGICPVFDVGLEGGAPYLAMKVIRGETLACRIAAARDGGGDSTFIVAPTAPRGEAEPPASVASRPRGAPPATTRELERLLRIVEEAARALHTAHEAGVIHRDVKPGNIMVSLDDAPTILDFGLAQDSDADAPALTRTGDVMGTPAYMSPEQVSAEHRRIDRRTDVYSLGATLFECLTLRRPFEAPTREGLYQAILTKDPPDATSLNPAVPDDLRVVVATALEKDRDRRYATAEDFAEDLRRVRMHEPIKARPAGPVLKLRRWTQRNPTLAASLLALFVALTSGLAASLHFLGKRDEALRDKSAALDDYDRLGDVSRHARLLAAAERLWPADPSKIPAMRAWLDEARRLESARPGHLAALRALRASEQEGPRPTSDRSGDDHGRRFVAESEQFKHDVMTKLTEDLAAFFDPDPYVGVRASVERRLRLAERLATEASTKYADRWAAAARSIGDPGECPRYEGLKLAPQIGLAPIRRDPRSGLWEFAHLETTAEGSDPLPATGADGRYELQESSGLIFVLLPGGTFRMGARRPTEEEEDAVEDGGPLPPNVDPHATEQEGPVHAVTLAPFFMSKYEMTQGQWTRVAGRNPSQFGPGSEIDDKPVTLSNPVEGISWEDCAGERGWIARLGLELPTEAQWEYACRAGTTTPWWGGATKECLRTTANVADQHCRNNGGPTNWPYEAWSDGFTLHVRVGSSESNRFGLHDMAGDVWEWCRDGFMGYPIAEARSGDGLRDAGPTWKIASYVLRGGSFRNDAESARSAARTGGAPRLRDFNLGVRPVRRLTAGDAAASRSEGR